MALVYVHLNLCWRLGDEISIKTTWTNEIMNPTSEDIIDEALEDVKFIAWYQMDAYRGWMIGLHTYSKSKKDSPYLSENRLRPERRAEELANDIARM